MGDSEVVLLNSISMPGNGNHQLLWMQLHPSADPAARVLDSSSSWTPSPLYHQDFFSMVISSSHIPATPSSTHLCIPHPAPRHALCMDSALTHPVIHMGSTQMKCLQVVVMMDLALSLKEQILSHKQYFWEVFYNLYKEKLYWKYLICSDNLWTSVHIEIQQCPLFDMLLSFL